MINDQSLSLDLSHPFVASGLTSIGFFADLRYVNWLLDDLQRTIE